MTVKLTLDAILHKLQIELLIHWEQRFKYLCCL